MAKKTTDVGASHLQFYQAHGISPVRQDISDWQRHVDRRTALYYQLGIRPKDIAGRRALEAGPGGGYNAMFTASLGPKQFVLLEGNPTGASELRENFAAKGYLNDHVVIVEGIIEEYTADSPFDFVFCEGVLSGVANPEEILDSLARATDEGGMLVTTCVDHLSHFPETIRRLLGQLLIDDDMTLQEMTEAILPAMTTHLNTLVSMNRRYDDWIVDNLIHPGSIIPLINFPETVAILAHSFEFFSSSPRFVQDWRWYKNIQGDDFEFNSGAIRSYWRNAHTFMDYRENLGERDEHENHLLYDRCTDARAMVARYEDTKDRIFVDKFCELLALISDDYQGVSPSISKAIREALSLLEKQSLTAQDIANAEEFGALFGRGQQYMAFLKQ